MEEPLQDPLDISKDIELIKDAQKDLSKVDVLVCGGCHEVYHFVEEFQKHKAEHCSGVSTLQCENEEKSPIWGFTLWKAKQTQIHQSKGEEVPSSWDVYQKWTKLEQSEKDLWISAGRTLQSCTKIANAKLVKEEKKIEKDPLALDDAFTGLENDLNNSMVKAVPILGCKKALRTNNDNEKEEYTVEKIVGKRFNPRKRIWEYEVKWENYKEETWEPLAHLENCKQLVQAYEEKIKAEKEKEKPPGAPRGRGRPRLHPQSPNAVKIVPKKPAVTPPTAVVITTPGGRPQRTSKQKALNQVKAWCGNISDGEEGVGKRPYEDDEGSDDSFEKKMKLEGEDEDTDDEEAARPPVKKMTKIVHTYNNGAGRKLPDNVLIPDAKGVVRISQKQLPSLSSGVYIMSKSSGIIKLDPAASKIATSGGQAIVKVSPKVGQTQIRIIKKDDGSKKMVQVKEGVQTTTPTVTTPVSVKKVVQQPQQAVAKTPLKKELEKYLRKTETPKTTPVSKVIVRERDETKSHEDDSDDGIPELEFPADLPIPEPDSPQGDFTLDPFTGKIAGQEYPDPEPEPVVHQEKKETPSETLDNIVKLAAADITEEDLKSDPETVLVAEPTVAIAVTTTATITPAVTITTSTQNTATPSKEQTLYAVVTQVKSSGGQSILNAAMANSNILQKTLQSPRPKTQPRIINQAVAKPRTSISPLVRTPTMTRPATVSPQVRPKQQVLPKPKFNIASVNTNKSIYAAKTPTNNVAKKIGSTTVYKTTKPTTQVVRKTIAPSPKTAPIAPKPVISMPSLDEEPVVLAPKVVNEAPATAAAPTVDAADLSTFTLASGDRPMFITGDDGTVYQVAGQNEEGQTILLTQDSDGQQQCLLVTNEALQEEVEQVENPTEVLMEVQEAVEMSDEQPLVAQFIRTEPPSPGGTHKVVVMLPDGDVMVTQVTPEEYASLELDK